MNILQHGIDIISSYRPSFHGKVFLSFFICLAPSGFLLPVPSGYLVVNGANPLLVACASLDALRAEPCFFRNGEKINTGFLYWQSKTTISAASPQVHYWRPVVFGFFFLLSKSATTRRKKFNQLKWFFGLAIHYRRIYRMQSRWLSNTVVCFFQFRHGISVRDPSTIFFEWFPLVILTHLSMSGQRDLANI